MTLQNLSKTSRTFSLEPYGDYCELGPDQKVYATWEVPPDGDVAVEVAITDDAVLVADASNPMSELRPNREEPGGDLWA
jgi:hypothetical protein